MKIPPKITSSINNLRKAKYLLGNRIDDWCFGLQVNFASAQASPKFNKAVIEEDDDEYEGWKFDDDDEGTPWDDNKVDVSALLNKYLHPGDGEVMRQALEVVFLERKASASYLQRRLGIGYNRAAELIDLMESRGIVAPPSGMGSCRKILIFDDLP